MRYQLTVSMAPIQPQTPDPSRSGRLVGTKQRLQNHFKVLERHLRKEVDAWPRRRSRTPMRLSILLKAAIGEGGERWSLVICGPKRRVSALFEALAPRTSAPAREKKR